MDKPVSQPQAPGRRQEDSGVAAPKDTLRLLNAQAQGLRAHLTMLRRTPRGVRRDFSENQMAQLREANEELVLAALHANTIAESAVDTLSQLTRISQRDVVTGMPNRALILDRLDYAITVARRHDTRIAVVFIDLDHFKPINDLLGHAAGDEVLQLVAQRLQSVVRESDTVSRYGGDEFLILLTDTAQPSDAALTVGKMLSALAAPTSVGGHMLRLSASVGITIFPQDGEDRVTLINRADAAMYRVKRAGGNDFDFHRENLPGEHPREPCAIDAPHPPVTRYQFVPTDPKSGLQDLRMANKELVINALTTPTSESDARQAQRCQIQFMAMVAHELRSPLTAIRIAAGLLTRRSPAGEMPFERLQVIIEQQVVHMSQLIDDLLERSRTSIGKSRLEREMVDLISILSLAVAMCQPGMDVRTQRLEVLLPPGPLKLFGDPVRLTQVFCNLLDNASKYTSAGGDIKLALDISERTVNVTVADNGIGIAAELLPTIFEPFVQDPQAGGSSLSGLGIGLAVVRNLVEAHGGSVSGDSLGRNLGSKFVVTLPLWLEAPDASTGGRVFARPRPVKSQ
ncbi:MAG TPA: diguanylate cyclase [Rhodanobacter sp.]|nr:diguanylate cyclase [Rhodanobacter sp.]